MALCKKSVAIVRNFFASNHHFESYTIHATNENQYGADEVYIEYKSGISNSEMEQLLSTSKKIGNTVSVVPRDNKLIICFW